MALVFTDDQIKKLSGDILTLPALIAQLNDDLASLNASIVDLEKTDLQNKVYSDNFIGIVSAYHSELLYLDGEQRSNYSDQEIIDGGNKANGHFPEPPAWIKFPPKLIDLNNGLPIVTGLDKEEDFRAPLAERIDVLVNGFNDGILDDTLAEDYVVGQPIEVTVGGFVIGQRVIVEQGAIALWATVTSAGATAPFCQSPDNPPQLDQVSCEADNGTWITPTGAEVITIDTISDENVVLTAGARIRNFHPGFNNTERESASLDGFLGILKAEVESKLSAYKPYVENQKIALESNDDIGANGDLNAIALNEVNDLFATIIDFETAPTSGAGIGRFGDSVLSPLNIEVIAREFVIGPRILEIASSLGNVIQDAEGVFSGAGAYLNLFTWIDLRINYAAGSLALLKQSQDGVPYLQQRIDGAENQKDQYAETFYVTVFAMDSTGSAFAIVDDETGLSIGDPVRVMDIDSAVHSRQIVDIQGSVIELDSAFPVLLVSKLARLVKEL